VAFSDPKIARIFSTTRFQLKLHDIDMERFTPSGDRYVIEILDVDESMEFGQLLVYVQPDPKKDGDPMADPTVENRGIMPGVIVAVGNGHLLGLPDIPVVIDGKVKREWASVPMFFKKGDVVLVDYNARGRNLKVAGRQFRTVNQIDILNKIEELRLQRTDDGGWEIEK
jgi:co-chaperonin GroES (HSP10)